MTDRLPRVLITGSRAWTDAATIDSRLDDVLREWGPFVLVSGACPEGADAICEGWARARGIAVERHPADWKRYGRSAGFKRNAAMVDLGADMCLAFVKDGSRGATMTYDMALRADIPSWRFNA